MRNEKGEVNPLLNKNHSFLRSGYFMEMLFIKIKYEHHAVAYMFAKYTHIIHTMFKKSDRSKLRIMICKPRERKDHFRMQ